MSNPLRSFVAIPICADSAPEAYTFLLSRRERLLSGSWARRVRWANPEHYHLTVHFLGQIEVEETAEWLTQLEHALRNIKPFELTMNAPCLFPRISRAKLVACPIEPHPELKRLRRIVQTVCSPLAGNEEQESKHIPYRAHATLGRIRRTGNGGKAPNLPSFPGSVSLPAGQLDIMASFPCEEGVRHEIVRRIVL